MAHSLAEVQRPASLDHEFMPSGDSYFTGQVFISIGAKNDYGLDVIKEAVAYLRYKAKQQGGLRYFQHFFKHNTPGMGGGDLIIQDSGTVDVRLRCEIR